MNRTRRNLLRSTLLVTAAALVACRSSVAVAEPNSREETAAEPAKPLSILILGGTGLIGPPLVEIARARGHKVTLFNRGRTKPNLFPDIEKLIGDRDPNKGEGLKALEGRKFDVVFDDCGYFPRMVTASAELLSQNIGHYVYISSISAYAENDVENADEDSKLATMADPTVETFGTNYEFYGPLKVLCEQAAERACPGRTTIIRPGYIVGPGDPTDRFTWWPLRVARGDEMLVPGNPTDPMQVIDVRDLSAFMVRVAENKTFGVFNAVGPAKPLTTAEVLAACKKATQAETATFTYVPTKFLAGLGLNLEETWPIWAPYEGKTIGFHTCSNERAIKAGMTFTPIEKTIADTIDWFRSLPPERQAAVKAGVSAEDEATWLAAWKVSKG